MAEGEQIRGTGRPAYLTSWMSLSLLTVLLWGAWGLESKIIVDRISPWMNQVIFSLGLIPAVAWMFFSKNAWRVSGSARKGAFYGLLTGILGGTGNLALYVALARGGKASIVVPLVGLAPLVTVILAVVFLRESINRAQWFGLVLALISIYLLSI